jgi:hypothetical protein
MRPWLAVPGYPHAYADADAGLVAHDGRQPAGRECGHRQHWRVWYVHPGDGQSHHSAHDVLPSCPGIYTHGVPLAHRYTPGEEEDEALLVARVPMRPQRPPAIAMDDEASAGGGDGSHETPGSDDMAARVHAVDKHTSLLVFGGHECPGTERGGICTVCGPLDARVLGTVEDRAGNVQCIMRATQLVGDA